MVKDKINNDGSLTITFTVTMVQYKFIYKSLCQLMLDISSIPIEPAILSDEKNKVTISYGSKSDKERV
jgi:hypothetical protein